MNRRQKAAELLEDARSTLPDLRASEQKIEQVRSEQIAEHGQMNARLVDAALREQRGKASDRFRAVIRAVSAAGRFGACEHPVEGLQQAINLYYDGERSQALDTLETLASEMHEANKVAGLADDKPRRRARSLYVGSTTSIRGGGPYGLR